MNKKVWDCPDSMDLEIQAIAIIPQVLNELSSNRAICLLEYLIERYKTGDNFGLK